MDGGEHWFHTEEQMRFMDEWINDKTVNLAVRLDYKYSKKENCFLKISKSMEIVA